MANARPTRLDLVMATWCPHCDPLSVELGQRLARHLGVPLRILDIDDRDQERLADALVERFGDWSPDYLIPQVFLEREGGGFEHLLTGVPGPTAGTRRAWAKVLDRFGAG
jgi:thiol-disulfide isomerase/thioredoxin